MRYLRSLGPAAVIAAAVAATIGAGAGPSGAATTHGRLGPGGASRAVFVQTDNTGAAGASGRHGDRDGKAA